MSELSQKSKEIIGEKQGVPIYRHNPSIPDPKTISKQKRVQYGDEKKGFVVDQGSGEILSVGGAAFYQYEEVDDTRFVKLFLAGVKQAAGLSKSGLNLFEVVYKQLQNRPSEDEVKLSYYIASDEITDLNERTYQRGLRELLDKEFLYRSPTEGVIFVNIRFMFNGDRLAFIRGYQRKGTAKQGELLLEHNND